MSLVISQRCLRLLSHQPPDPCGEAEGDGWPAPSSPVGLRLSCQGLQIRAGGEEMAGSRQLSSGQISPDAQAGLIPDSSAAARADLSLHRAVLTPGCHPQCQVKRELFFRVLSQPEPNVTDVLRTPLPNRNARKALGTQSFLCKAPPPSLHGSPQGVGEDWR